MIDALVRAALDGDIRAFDRLYRDHVHVVARVAARYQRDHEIIADIVQETFARVFEQLGSLSEPAKFRSWTLTIARNVAVDAGRREGRRREVFAEPGDDPESVEPGPAEAAELEELAGAVRHCVAGLSTRDATAIELVARFGLSTSEVAVALGVSPSTARVVLHRARRRLRRALTTQHEYDTEGFAASASTT